MAIGIGLFSRFLHRYDDIPQGNSPGAGIQIAGLDLRHPVLEMKKGKREHIGRGLYVSVFRINLFYPIVVHQRNAYIEGMSKTILPGAEPGSLFKKTDDFPRQADDSLPVVNCYCHLGFPHHPFCFVSGGCKCCCRVPGGCSSSRTPGIPAFHGIFR